MATIGGVLFGYDTSNIGSALTFIPFDKLSGLTLGYLVAGASLGAAVGTLLAGPITDHFGRKSLAAYPCAFHGAQCYGIRLADRIRSGLNGPHHLGRIRGFLRIWRGWNRMDYSGRVLPYGGPGQNGGVGCRRRLARQFCGDGAIPGDACLGAARGYANLRGAGHHGRRVCQHLDA